MFVGHAAEYHLQCQVSTDVRWAGQRETIVVWPIHDIGCLSDLSKPIHADTFRQNCDIDKYSAGDPSQIRLSGVP
jgi:hypothetical protein